MEWVKKMSENELKILENSWITAQNCDEDDEAQMRRKTLSDEFHAKFKYFDTSIDGVLDKTQFQ